MKLKIEEFENYAKRNGVAAEPDCSKKGWRRSYVQTLEERLCYRLRPCAGYV